MKFSRLDWLKQQLGKDTSVSPSPFAHWLKGILLEVERGYSKVSFEVRKEMTNPAGMLHGGVIAGMFDDIMGMTFFGLDTDRFYPTISLNVEYLAAAREKDTVIVEARVTKEGKNVMFLEAKMFSAEGKLLARGSSSIVASEMKV